MRIKLTISYIGKNYSGWQSQTGGNTIQDKVERALALYFDGQFVRISAAGRTDAGVNASAQVAHFDAPVGVNPYKLCLGANLNLPDDIAIVDAEVVADDFDARFSAHSKTYVYRLYISATRKPLLDTTHAQIYRPLDVTAMQNAAAVLVGTHDFAAFQATGSNLKGTVRTIYRLDVTQGTDDTIDIAVCGNAFLYNMVRKIAGTLVEVGKGRLIAADVGNILSQTTPYVGKTLPPHGLTLQKIDYPQ